MAKQDRSEKKARAKGADPLAEAISVFGRGDYAQAGAMLDALRTEASLSEGAKQQASQLFQATRVERGALYVGLATAGLVLFVVIATMLTQPG